MDDESIQIQNSSIILNTNNNKDKEDKRLKGIIIFIKLIIIKNNPILNPTSFN